MGAPPISERRTYAIPGLPWGCSPAHARASLEKGSTVTAGSLTAAGVLPFEGEQSGFRVHGEAHFTWGILTHVRTTCAREDGDMADAATFFGEMAGLFLRTHGPYEPIPPIADGKIVRQWPSDERGSLRMTLNLEGEILILYHSGVHS